jgi:cytochrome c oxidase accessory protein FixG
VLGIRPVEGRYRRLRWAANGVLIAILFAIPWVRIGGEPLVWLDVPGRKFHVLGLVIFPQELFFLWLILLGLALGLFFFTALAGRLWCGWACPQTVFTDVFAAVARRIEGWRGNNPPRHVAPWRRALTYVVFAALSLLVGVHVVGYFHPIDDLLSRTVAGDPPATAAGFVLVVSALAFFDFVVLRQTFCKFLCPYARFQSVLFDKDTLVIGYDARRGEPRGKRGTTSGDCVDCGLCVAVCPSEIDIREGMQMECIACTQCIDACDGVMARLDRPRGLIDYRSWVSLEGLREARLIRPRVIVYALLLLAVGAGFATTLARRVPMELQVTRNRERMFGAVADGRISNAYTLYLTNRAPEPHRFEIVLEAPESFELLAGANPIEVGATRHLETRVFVVADPSSAALGPRPTPIRFRLRRVSDDGERELVRASTFVAPSGGASARPQGGIHAGH